VYNVRDLLGHFVKPRSREDKMCPHACCKNKRVHPANFPVILPGALLRKASDDELADHWGKHDDPRVRKQVLGELDRRDRAAELRRARASGAKSRRSDRQYAQAQAVEAAIMSAERDTNGNMLNRRARAAGIDERSLFTGSEERARRYASEELLNHWRRNPRPTRANLAAEPTTRQRRARQSSSVTSYGDLY
jgi:hypothetical protein